MWIHINVEFIYSSSNMRCHWNWFKTLSYLLIYLLYYIYFSDTVTNLTRKWAQNTSEWRQLTRKHLRQSGKEYKNTKGVLTPARDVKTKKDCTKCKFKCSECISCSDQERINSDFWKIGDIEGQKHFFAKTTQSVQKQRSRSENSSRRSLSYAYFLPVDGINYRVCERFYTGTLNINKTRIYKFHQEKSASETPAKSK